MPGAKKSDTLDDLKILLVEDSRGDAAAFKRAMTRVNPRVHVCVIISAEEASLPIPMMPRGHSEMMAPTLGVPLTIDCWSDWVG